MKRAALWLGVVAAALLFAWPVLATYAPSCPNCLLKSQVRRVISTGDTGGRISGVGVGPGDSFFSWALPEHHQLILARVRAAANGDAGAGTLNLVVSDGVSPDAVCTTTFTCSNAVAATQSCSWTNGLRPANVVQTISVTATGACAGTTVPGLSMTIEYEPK